MLVFPGHRVYLFPSVFLLVRPNRYLRPSFYGINLNQNVVLQQIGFAGKSGTPWERLFEIGIGNLIITVLGFVPGRQL
jgi:hypothetical protein